MAGRVERDSMAWCGSPLVAALGWWIVGTLTARAIGGGLVVCFVLMAIGGVAMAATWRRGAGWLAASAAVTIAAAAGAVWLLSYEPSPGATLRVEPESRLARLEGVIVGSIFTRVEAKGAMGGFDYRAPGTLFLLRADREIGDGGRRELAGSGPRLVIVDSPSYDGRLRSGDRVRVTGWLSGPRRRLNPGERDQPSWMRDRGEVGRLTLKARGNCQIIEASGGAGEAGPTGLGAIGRWRQDLVDGAGWSLRHGLESAGGGQSLAMLDALLLGESRDDMGELGESFRRAGLNHLLAISGLHLGILAAGAWWLLSAATGRPGAAAIGTLAVIGVYVLVVPANVPILRAAIMTAVACAALTWGRRVSAMGALSLAAMGLLVWRPGDLFNAGFQLSFVIVAALVLYAGSLGRWLLGERMEAEGATGRTAATWYAADYLGVSLVAWCFAAPLTAYHFGTVTPIALPMALAMLPPVAALLWLGYAKILVTAAWPAAGAALAEPLRWIADATARCVTAAADVPGATWPVPQPGAMWTAAAIATAAMIFGGAMARRRRAAVAAVSCLTLWLIAPTLAERTGLAADDDAAMRLTMFAVGNGSAYLVQSGGQAMMFDCGSGNYIDITTGAVGPTLRTLGVSRIGTLVVSHGDLDHFSGAIELIDSFGVERLLTTALFTDEADAWPDQAAAALIRHARDRGVDVVSIASGWTQRLGETDIEAIWPPAGRRFERSNDGSIVLRLTAAGRRVLLSGDVQQAAMSELLAAKTDLRADVLELPHHGSMVAASSAFVGAVDPAIVLQSTGEQRLRRDKWADLLTGRTRHVSARHGMTRVTIARDGSLQSARFAEETAPAADP